MSPLTGERVNRFLHVATSADDLVLQNKMQRRLGQLTGTCFQRCVGMDALNTLHSVTYEMDERCGTAYHPRFKAFLADMQRRNLVIGGAMTDVKGDRSKAPHQQADPDLYLHVSRRSAEGVWVRGAKAHQTGCINSHWLIVMPTLRLGPEDADYAIVGALPVDAPGITYVYGRQSCDTRSMEGGTLDAGNAALQRPGSAGDLRRRVHPHRAHLHGRRDRRSPPCWSSASPATTGAATCARAASATC